MQKKLLALCLILCTVIFLTACGKKDESPTSKAQVETQKVVVAKVKSATQSVSSELTGVLKASEETALAFEVPGKVLALQKKEGDTIRVGEIVATLDAKDYLLAEKSAGANIMQANAGLQQANSGARVQEIRAVEAGLAKAQAGYEKMLADYKRIKELYKEGAVSQSVYEDASTGLVIAKKDLFSAEQGYSLVKEGARSEDKERARAGVQLAEVSKEQADLTINKTSIKSSVAGTVLSKMTSQGQLISAGMPVYIVGNTDTLKILLPVPDQDIFQWEKGDQVELTLYGQKRTGKVTNILPSTSQGSGTIGVEITLPNSKHDWYVGQVVSATHLVESKKAVFVPVEAVISRGENQQFVYRPINNKAVKTLVKIGDLINNQFEITSGLNEGETIVVQGADKLYDGQLIESAGGI
jgi:multidrug efflux pump subunit AcrA (membrane-fusion protein)